MQIIFRNPLLYLLKLSFAGFFDKYRQILEKYDPDNSYLLNFTLTELAENFKFLGFKISLTI